MFDCTVCLMNSAMGAGSKKKKEKKEAENANAGEYPNGACVSPFLGINNNTSV